MWRELHALAPSARGPLLALLFGVASAALVLAARRLSAPPVPSVAAILTVAALLRLLALPLAPSLSGDVHRYLWDGRVLLAGGNPYRLAPADPALAPLREAAGEAGWRRIEHPEVPTVYPPLALGLFALAAAAPAPLAAWKVLLAVADLAGCAALLALARRLGLPLGRAVWYAWNPLVVVETAGMGHVDALGVAAAVAAVLLVVRARGAIGGSAPGPAGGAGSGSPGVGAGDREGARRPSGVRWALAAGAAAGSGALAKLAPALALPLWARQSGLPLVLLGAAGLLVAAGLVPVVAAAGGVPPGLVTYGVSWEFNGPLYEPAWRLLDAAGADLRVKALFDRVEERTGRWDLMDRLYPYVYPRLLARAGLALLLAAALARSVLTRRSLADPVAGTGRLFAAALLASATVYPWYLLWVLPWAALARQRAWLLAAAVAPLAYLAAPVGPVGLAGGDAFPWIWLAVWGPPALAALLSPGFRRWSTG